MARKRTLPKVRVARVPKSFGLKSRYMTEVREGPGYRVYKYHRNKRTANKEATRIRNLNK